MIHEDPDAITGLGFKQTALQFVVFASTRHHVLSFTLGVKSGEKIHKEILDEHGCKSKCAGITDSVLENQFLVGRLVTLPSRNNSPLLQESLYRIIQHPLSEIKSQAISR